MDVISGLRNSGFLAQSAYSAAVATNDSLGRNISETYLTAHQDLSDYATNTLVEETSGAITSLIPTDYYPDNNPSGFITGVDLTPYQTIEGMTAYQEAGDYYSASNPSGFITGVDLTPYATTAEVNTLSSFLSGAIDYVSANAGGDGAISSYTTTWSHDVPPYGSQVINSLNGLYISSFVSNSAGTANNATNAKSALSAGYAQTVNTTYVENQGFVRNLSSEYSTIYVTHNNLIDSTNSAILRTGVEGFVSSFSDGQTIGPQSTAHYSWDNSLPNNMFTIGLGWVSYYSTLFYSADTNLTGQIELPQGGGQAYSFDIPNATALDIWCTDYVAVDNAAASAADTFETVVGELAWASALPSYEYNSTNKISAINGSAIAAGDEFPASANEAITAYQTNSGTYLTAISIPDSASWNNVSSKLDITAFSDVSGTFLTAVDLTPYATTNDLEQVSGEITALIPTDYYPNTNPSGFISGVDLTPYQTTAGMVDYAKASAVDDKLDTTAYSTVSADLISVSSTVNSNSASWAGGGGGGGSYTSPNNTIWISADNIESTDSAYIPSHPEDVLLTAISSWSSINGYRTLDNTNKVYFWPDSNRASAFDNEGTFLNSSNNAPAWAETQYPPIKLYTNSWVSVKFSAYSAGIMDAYVVELARKNDVNSALNNKLDSSAFTGYYPSNNPSGFVKASDVVLSSSFNLFDGRVVGVNNQYLMACDSAYNNTFVGTSAATGTKTASAYVGTGHQGIDIQISARNTGNTYVNWTAFSENGSNLSAGQLYLYVTTANKVSALEFNSPLAENISGVKLFGNNLNFTAYSAYTIDVKPLASQSNITFLSGAIDYVSANAGGGGGSVTLPITGSDGNQDMTLDVYGLHIGIPEGGYSTTNADYGTYISMSQTDSDNTMDIGPNSILIGDSTSTALFDAQSIRDLRSVSGTVNANSASWGGGGQISLSSLNDAGINNIIITASFPSIPDANTLYLIPET